jgi:hypothetical protein
MDMTVMALFHSTAEAQPTIDDLLASTPVHREDITVVPPGGDGHHHRDPLADADRSQMLTDVVRLGTVIGLCVGALLGALASLGELNALATALGPAVTILVGAGIGGLSGIAIASLLAGITSLGASDQAMHLYGEGLEQGATLVGVVTREGAVRQVEEILRQHGGEHIQKRRGAWRHLNVEHV